MVHTEVPYEGSCEGSCDGDKTTELEGSKKVQGILYCPTSESYKLLL